MPTLICVSPSKEDLQTINSESGALQTNCAPNEDSCWPD